MSDSPLISVVVPVKNERKNIEACLEGIFRQTVRDKLEVIVIDSGSTDGTLEILAKYPVRVHRIPPEEFNCSETRNLGVRLARGEFVVMTVGDARAVDEHWIENLLECFSDPRVAAVCGQQRVPHDKEKNPLAWFRPISPPGKRVVSFRTPQEFQSLHEVERWQICRWDDVTAMYRRSMMLKVPYVRLNYLCDQVWARDALSQGCVLMHNSAAAVYHYHHETFKYSFRKTLSIDLDSHRFFNCLMPIGNPFVSTAQIIVRVARERSCRGMEKLRWLRNNLAIQYGCCVATWLFWLTLKISGTKGVEKLHRHFLTGFPIAQRQASSAAQAPSASTSA